MLRTIPKKNVHSEMTKDTFHTLIRIHDHIARSNLGDLYARLRAQELVVIAIIRLCRVKKISTEIEKIYQIKREELVNEQFKEC